MPAPPSLSSAQVSIALRSGRAAWTTILVHTSAEGNATKKNQSPIRRKAPLVLLLGGLLVAVSVSLARAAPLAQSTGEGEALFQEQCAACHTLGGGATVGPDLRGVTLRRERDWLRRWIAAPDEMLAAGDPIATALLADYNNLPMPNLGLTEAEVEAVIAYLAAEDESEAPRAQSLLALSGESAVGGSAFQLGSGFLGTDAPWPVDVNLLLQVAFYTTLCVGVVAQRRQQYRWHERLQSSIVILNLLVIVTLMIPSLFAFRRLTQDVTFRWNMDYLSAIAVPLTHAALGALAEGLAIYCFLAGRGILPRKFGVLRRWMWAAFISWTITVSFGVGVYIFWFVYRVGA